MSQRQLNARLCILCVHLVGIRTENRFKIQLMCKFKIPVTYIVLVLSVNLSVLEVPIIAASTVLNCIGIVFEGYLEISE
jgi:hypothetical protein